MYYREQNNRKRYIKLPQSTLTFFVGSFSPSTLTPFSQPIHLHEGPHFLPILKHSQYFFKHFDFRQLHASLMSSELVSFREKAYGSLVMILFIASDRAKLSVRFLHPSHRQLFIPLYVPHCTSCPWKNTHNTFSSTCSFGSYSFLREEESKS